MLLSSFFILFSALTSNSDESNFVICWLSSALRPGTLMASVVCILTGVADALASSSSSSSALLAAEAASGALEEEDGFFLFLPALVGVAAAAAAAAAAAGAEFSPLVALAALALSSPSVAPVPGSSGCCPVAVALDQEPSSLMVDVYTNLGKGKRDRR